MGSTDKKAINDYINNAINRYHTEISNEEATAILLSLMDGSYSTYNSGYEDRSKPMFRKEQLTALGMGALALSNEGLDKRYITPQKVRLASTRWSRYDFWCPTCNRGILSKEYDYCPWCGQALDWEDVIGNGSESLGSVY